MLKRASSSSQISPSVNKNITSNVYDKKNHTIRQSNITTDFKLENNKTKRAYIFTNVKVDKKEGNAIQHPQTAVEDVTLNNGKTKKMIVFK